jgi:hypothetical protein
MTKIGAGVLAILLALSLAGCANGESIAVQDAWIRPAPLEGGNGAAYMTIRNRSDEVDSLLAVEGDVAEALELHMTMHMEGDVVGMVHSPHVDIPARGKVVFEPGGYHVMLIGVGKRLVPGTRVTLTLVFEEAGRIPVEFEVRNE